MACFATVHTEFLFEAAFPFFWGESSSFEGSTTTSISGINFCSGGLFSGKFLDLRGKVAVSASTRERVGSRCEHVEGTIQVSSFIH